MFRVVLHLDLDAFYCQVEHKRLNIPRDIPLAVQQWEGLIAVNYPAKKLGIKRHTKIDEARKICPDIRLVHVETIGNRGDIGAPVGEVEADRTRSKASLERYRKASLEVTKVMQTFSTSIERASIDEVYIDVTADVDKMLEKGMNNLSWNNESHVVEGFNLDPAMESDIRLILGSKICNDIRKAVKEHTTYDISAGISHNKLLSKLASAMNKPNKQTIVPTKAITNLMKNLPFHQIRGLGGKAGQRVKESLPGVSTAFDLQRFDLQILQKLLGEKSGLWLYKVCRGEDTEEIKPNLLPKSLNACKSFPKCYMDQLKNWLKILSAELIDRMEKDMEAFQRWPKVLVLHARSAVSYEERSRQGPMPGNGKIPKLEVLLDAALKLFDKIRQECLPCSRISIGANDFIPLGKDMHKLSVFYQNQLSDISKKNKLENIDVQDQIKVKGEQIETKMLPNDNGETGAGFNFSKVDLSEQRYILAQIARNKNDSKDRPQKSKKAKTSGNQKNLAQFWKKPS